jgi:Condensation domain
MSLRENEFEPMGDTRFLRHLGAQERLLQLYSIEHPRHFCVVAEIAGELAWDDFRPAFDKVQRRHPMLNVEILTDEHSAKAFYTVDRQIELEIKPLYLDYDWMRIVELELIRPLHESVGPLMRATILYQPQRSQIILSFHHAISDGLSAAFIIRDLMAALNGEDLQPLLVSPSAEALAELLSTRAITPGADWDKKVDPNLLLEIAKKPLWRDFEGDQPTVSTLALGKALTRKIRETAKAQATTVHGALGAALALSAIENDSAASYTITSPINMRDTLKLSGGECGLYVGASTTRIPAEPDASFWEVAREVTEQIGPRSTAGLSSLEAIAANVPIHATPAIASGLFGLLGYDAILSNLGVLAIPETIGNFQLTAFWGPMVQGRFKHERVIGASTIGERLRIVQTSPKHISSLLDRMQERLQAAT